jgi:flagellar hook-basal body protein
MNLRAKLGSPALLATFLGLSASACGGALSSDERWPLDDDGTSARPLGNAIEDVSDELSAVSPPRPTPCSVDTYPEHHYAEPPEFWLGSQAATPLAVRGAGYLVSSAVAGPPLQRFAAQTQLSVAPDGSLADSAGRQLLGYLPETHANGPCVVPLRAPSVSAPEATTSVSIDMNLDPRSPIKFFDVLDPDSTANGSTSFTVIDSLGAGHIIDVYFTNQGGNFWQYSVIADGSDVAGGVPGDYNLVGEGWLQFTSDGALETATTPPVCPEFSGGATAALCFDLTFGPDITSNGTAGLSGTTQFASALFVYVQDVNGHVAGTGSDVHVDGYGEVTVEYDSGATLMIGTLALARFATEAALAPEADGSFSATNESGPPQMGYPTGPGRGSLE